MTVSVTTQEAQVAPVYHVIIGTRDAEDVFAQGEAGDSLETVIKAAAAAVDPSLVVVRSTANNTATLEGLVIVREGGSSRTVTNPAEVVAPGATIIVNKTKSNG